MSKTIAYLRVSTSKQDLDTQKLAILEYAARTRLPVHEFMEVTVSSRKNERERKIEELLDLLEPADTLIVTELSRLGRSTHQVINIVNQITQKKVRLIAIKENLDIKQEDMSSKIVTTLFSLFAELERDLISLRTKEALASKKAQGKTLGKPKGTIQKSKFDRDTLRIQELLSLGLSRRKIANLLGYTNHIALTTFIKKRNLKKEG